MPTQKHPRVVSGISWGPDSELKVRRIPVYPTATEPTLVAESEDLPALRADLDLYIEAVITLIVDNRKKSKYMRYAPGEGAADAPAA